jgi:hypothetical protein
MITPCQGIAQPSGVVPQGTSDHANFLGEGGGADIAWPVLVHLQGPLCRTAGIQYEGLVGKHFFRVGGMNALQEANASVCEVAGTTTPPPQSVP